MHSNKRLRYFLSPTYALKNLLNSWSLRNTFLILLMLKLQYIYILDSCQWLYQINSFVSVWQHICVLESFFAFSMSYIIFFFYNMFMDNRWALVILYSLSLFVFLFYFFLRQNALYNLRWKILRWLCIPILRGCIFSFAI